MKQTLALAAWCLCLSPYAFAAEVTAVEGESKVTVEEVRDPNTVPGDIDQDITNAKLRAESGSKSKFSISTSLGYSGGALDNAFAARRPALSKDPGTQRLSSLSLNPELRYRWTKNDSVTAGNGFAVMTPLQGDVTRKPGGQRVNQVNFFDPFVAYNRAGRIGNLQVNGSIGSYVGTSNESRDIEQSFQPNAAITVLHVFDNGLTVGSTVGASYMMYDSKPGQAKMQALNTDSYGHDERNSFALGVYPFLEYAFNDRYSFRTLFGYFNFQHRYGDPNNWRLLQDMVYQSVGVGISITRDIYLYPNIQFSPDIHDQITLKRTNVAMTATINVF